MIVMPEDRLECRVELNVIICMVGIYIASCSNDSKTSIIKMVPMEKPMVAASFSVSITHRVMRPTRKITVMNAPIAANTSHFPNMIHSI